MALAPCSTVGSGWALQQGYATNQTLLHVRRTIIADIYVAFFQECQQYSCEQVGSAAVKALHIADSCLTVGAKPNAKVHPNTPLELDQCWHINKTQNFLLPGVSFRTPPPPPPPPPHPTPSTTAWAVSDLTIYITHWCRLPSRLCNSNSLPSR